jgi:hypothetical protein
LSSAASNSGLPQALTAWADIPSANSIAAFQKSSPGEAREFMDTDLGVSPMAKENSFFFCSVLGVKLHLCKAVNPTPLAFATSTDSCQEEQYEFFKKKNKLKIDLFC